jgi:hypothetical protein
MSTLKSTTERSLDEPPRLTCAVRDEGSSEAGNRTRSASLAAQEQTGVARASRSYR